MNDPENFLTRWSRRKREVADAPGEADQQPAASPAEHVAGTEPPATAAPAEPLVDLTKLPPIESITAETDIRSFFAPGVPAELTRAALRRAWVADPKIRDFVGLNDYDFDFHTPGAIPGFGSLEMTDELRRELARIVGDLVPEAEPPQPSAAAATPASEPPPQPVAEGREIEVAAAHSPQPSEDPASSAPDNSSGQPEEILSPPAPAQRNINSAALQQEMPRSESLQTPARRAHGGALPK